MIDLLSATQNLLRDSGFSTQLTSMERDAIICFEDASFLGFCSVFDDMHQLIEGWYTRETATLNRFAPRIRQGGDKAWNVYSVFLCADAGDSAESRQVRWIEEDLERTRKIVGYGITGREELSQALLPILPLQYQPALEPQDVLIRLKSRITTIAPRAAEAVLDEGILPIEVVRLMGDLP